VAIKRGFGGGTEHIEKLVHKNYMREKYQQKKKVKLKRSYNRKSK